MSAGVERVHARNRKVGRIEAKVGKWDGRIVATMIEVDRRSRQRLGVVRLERDLLEAFITPACSTPVWRGQEEQTAQWLTEWRSGEQLQKKGGAERMGMDVAGQDQDRGQAGDPRASEIEVRPVVPGGPR